MDDDLTTCQHARVPYRAVQITDRTAGSLRPSEVARWNDRVSRLEAEIMEERERRWEMGGGVTRQVVDGRRGAGGGEGDAGECPGTWDVTRMGQLSTSTGGGRGEGAWGMARGRRGPDAVQCPPCPPRYDTRASLPAHNSAAPCLRCCYSAIPRFPPPPCPQAEVRGGAAQAAGGHRQRGIALEKKLHHVGWHTRLGGQVHGPMPRARPAAPRRDARPARPLAKPMELTHASVALSAW